MFLSGLKTSIPRTKDSSLLVKVIDLRIKDLREQNSVTQEVFYNDTGINIGRIERGINDLSVCTLDRICLYFEITLLDFFEDMR